MTSHDEQHPDSLAGTGDFAAARPLGMPPMPPLPSTPALSGPLAADAPPALRPVAALLVANLALSIIVTVATALTHNSIIDYQLDHRHIVDPAIRETLRSSYSYTVITRAITNIALSIVYAFLLRALFRGRRWAYRRVIVLSAFGIFALLSLLATPYPEWMRVEQAVQALVLAALLYFVTRPSVRAYFDPTLPGRNVRRFNR